MRKFLVINWFTLIVAACTVTATMTGIITELLALGFLEFIWDIHNHFHPEEQVQCLQ